MKAKIFENWLILLPVAAAILAASLFLLRATSREGLERRVTFLSPKYQQPVFITRDRLMSSTTEASILSKTWNAWDLGKAPFPKGIPEYRVEWNGTLFLPELPRESINGLTESVYRGATFRGPPIRRRQGVLPAIDTRGRQEIGEAGAISIEWLGSLQIEREDHYTFFLNSDDGSLLMIDNKLVVDNSGTHREKEVSGKILLSPGSHPILIRYTDLGGAAKFTWKWKFAHSAHSDPQEIPTTVLSPFSGGSVFEVKSSFPDSALRIGQNVLGLKSKLMMASGGSQSIFVGALGLGNSSSFELIWRSKGGVYQPLPASVLRVPEEFRGESIDLLPILLLGGSVILVIFAQRKGTPEGLFHALTITILALGFSLRWFQYSELPRLMDTIDEFMAPWSGLNFLQSGKLRSWVFPGVALETQVEMWLGRAFLLTDYAFHPPPLWPLITGVFSLLGGAGSMYEIRASVFRIPAILSGTLTILPLVYFLKRKFGPRSAILGGLLFATLPMFVLLGRLNKEETPLALLAMTALFLLERSLSQGSKRSFQVLLLLILLGPLCKELGMFIGLFAGLSFHQHGKRREAVLAVLATALGEAIYLCAGLFMHPQEFLQGVYFHANLRDRIGFLNTFFSDLRIWQPTANSVYLWLWFAAVSCREPRYRLVWTALGAFLLVYFFIAPAPYDYPWYRICVFPFLTILAGGYLSRLFARAEIQDIILFGGLVLMVFIQLLNVSGPGIPMAVPTAKFWSVLFVSGAIVFMLASKRARSLMLVGSMFFFILSNVYLVFCLERFYSGSLGGYSNIL